MFQNKKLYDKHTKNLYLRRLYMNKTIYVTGHRHPDTDSVASAISYAYFKQQLGEDCIACRLGELSDETKYLLDRFDFVKPYYLKDARATLAEIQLDDPVFVTPDTSIQKTLSFMEEKQLKSVGVADQDGKLRGIVTMRDISMIGLGDTSKGIDLMKETRVDAICETIEGKLIYNDPQVHINGKVSIIALTQSKLSNYEIRDRIVIVGDDKDAQIELIKKGAGILIVVWSKGIDEDVIEVAEEYHCPIIISGHGSMNTSRYLYFAPPVRLIMTKELITFNYWQLVEEVSQTMTNLTKRHSAYPVIDEKGCLVGYVGRYHIMSSKNKSLILVDHNEFAQSVRAIETAELLEVIDHHRIRDFSTSKPVSFRNEIVGSTATIITGMYQERQIPIPKNMAGLMLGAILSDTLKFRSPTTTQKDIFMANVLAQIAQVNIDDFAKDMFSVSTNISNKSMFDVLRTDMKYLDIGDLRLRISQVIVYDMKAIEDKQKEIDEAAQTIFAKSDCDVYLACFTSITENGSVFYSYGKKVDWISNTFADGEFQPNILSRKTQIVPKLTDAFSQLI